VIFKPTSVSRVLEILKEISGLMRDFSKYFFFGHNTGGEITGFV